MSMMQRTMLGVAATAAIGLSGCFLQTISGATFAVGGSLITSVQTDSVLTTCVQGGSTGGNVECTYFFTDENGVPVDVTSSADLISEFGILGVVIDPLILQVPLDAGNVSGTYDDGAGLSGALDIQSGFRSIPVDTHRTLFAEPGQQFIIAELPDGVPFDGIGFVLSLTFEQPGDDGAVSVKPLLALKYDAGKQVFHTPFLPCVTDMTAVPAVTIPTAATPQPIPVASLPQGCNGEQYLLAGFGVFACDFDADNDVDIDDLVLQASARNAPALPGDRLDNDSNGFIDINDVRRCALQCTRPACATSLTRDEGRGFVRGERQP